jgi:hypothetical protein
MGKRYFVLKNGYLNIDETHFYFSDHGNWETCNILEETELPRVTFFQVSNKIIHAIYLVLFCVFIIGFITGKADFSYAVLSFGAIFHLLNLLYKVKYFKIPLHKIERIELRNQKVIVHFKNRTNKSITHTVKLDDLKEYKDILQYFRTHFNQKLRVA